MKQRKALRMDDVGASSKLYEIYSKKFYGLGNFWFLKQLKPFAAWGPYEEMSCQEWEEVLAIIEKYSAKLTVGITACWVEYDGTLTPFPVKFPEQAKLLKIAQRKGLIEIANHGLTHCVLKSNLFRPQFFKGNRAFHREFWDWQGRDLHFDHIKKSQQILQEYFDTDVVTLIPPGNVFCEHTLDAAIEHGLKFVNCNLKDSDYRSLKLISNANVIAFHDKEIVQIGPQWLEKTILQNEAQWVFTRELG